MAFFLKAITTDGKTEYFNSDKIISIKPNGENVKILMGAGMFWNVKSDSLQFVHPEQMIMQIKQGV